MIIITTSYADKMPPKLSAAERAQFKAEAKSTAAAEIRSKKRHSMHAAATTPATTSPATTIPPLPQTENPIPTKVKGKETAIVVADPLLPEAKGLRDWAFLALPFKNHRLTLLLHRPRNSRRLQTKTGV